MFLGNTLSSASSGLDSIERQLAVLSQNVANASTPNYVRESTPVTSAESAGGPAGVRTGQAVRELDVQLQSNLFASVATEAGSNVTRGALSSIDAASGAPGSGQDLASLVGKLQDSFSALDANPSSQTQQAAVLGSATSLVDGIHLLSASLVQARQKAQDSLSDGVDIANGALKTIGKLSDQIIAARSQGQSTAGLETDRDGQMKSLATLTGAKFVRQASGDVQVIAGNTILPTRADSGPFSLWSVPFTAGTNPSAVPALMMNGSPVTGMGGEMGANVTLRDATIPGMQNQLDGFTQSLATSFSAVNMPLLTDGAGSVPSTASQLGFSSTVQVSGAFQTNSNMLRDGTGAALLPGDNTNIRTVLNSVFSSASAGAPAQATKLVAGFAQQSTQAASVATSSAALRTGLESRLATRSGVSVDSELAQMVQLQTAYAANAKVVSAVQSMWTQLLEVVR
ncbi:MAG: flagellar hook-associated protein FlgK [Pseudomonadota bacterium]|nr:flagellar hook-associated protein FlgK [Pseudomonadota bacterium]